MKIIYIGDLHGVEHWEIIAKNHEKWDKIVFLGDYVDSFDISPAVMISNLKKVIDFKKEFSDKVVLLTGNHDTHYMFTQITDLRCSGFNPRIMHRYHEIFKENFDLFQLSECFDDTLVSHAGICESFLEKQLSSKKPKDVSDELNFMFDQENFDVLNMVSKRRGGFDSYSGPLWLDWSELIKDHPGFDQIVGHTGKYKIQTIHDQVKLFNVDCLVYGKIEFLEQDLETKEYQIIEKEDLI